MDHDPQPEHLDGDQHLDSSRHLDSNQRDTLAKIFQHPAGHNIEWHGVLSLLKAAGSVESRHDGKVLVRVGAVSEVLTPPKHKDIEVAQVVDLRRMLTAAGYDTVAAEMSAKGKQV